MAMGRFDLSQKGLTFKVLIAVVVFLLMLLVCFAILLLGKEGIQAILDEFVEWLPG
jgi:hypothetical protein